MSNVTTYLGTSDSPTQAIVLVSPSNLTAVCNGVRPYSLQLRSIKKWLLFFWKHTLDMGSSLESTIFRLSSQPGRCRPDFADDKPPGVCYFRGSMSLELFIFRTAQGAQVIENGE
jgi:hypothetical protein